MSKWIKCSEETPPEHDYVLVYSETESDEPGGIAIARYYQQCWEMLTDEDCNAVACGDITWFMEPQEITHWMPLPKVPT